MADNHSPYDPDPRQGRGGDRRTQALQAVSHFHSRNLRFISARSPKIALDRDPLPFCRRGRIGATSARRLHRRQHTFGSTIEKLSDPNGHKGIANLNVEDHFLSIHDNRSIIRDGGRRATRSPRRPERAKKSAVARTKEQHAQSLRPAPELFLPHVSRKVEILSRLQRLQFGLLGLAFSQIILACFFLFVPSN